MTLQRIPKFEFKPEDIQLNYGDLTVYDYLDWFGTNENAQISLQRRIEEINELVERIREQFNTITHINVDYTIQPNGSR